MTLDAATIGALGACAGILIKGVLDYRAQQQARDERAAAAAKAEETKKVVVGHLDKQDETLDLIHTASNSNLAASEQRNKDAQVQIKTMADDAVQTIAAQMASLKAELAAGATAKALEAAEAIRATAANLAAREAAITARENAPRRR